VAGRRVAVDRGIVVLWRRISLGEREKEAAVSRGRRGRMRMIAL
jgi:hypothetical protein